MVPAPPFFTSDPGPMSNLLATFIEYWAWRYDYHWNHPRTGARSAYPATVGSLGAKRDILYAHLDLNHPAKLAVAPELDPGHDDPEREARAELRCGSRVARRVRAATQQQQASAVVRDAQAGLKAIGESCIQRM